MRIGIRRKAASDSSSEIFARRNASCSVMYLLPGVKLDASELKYRMVRTYCTQRSCDSIYDPEIRSRVQKAALKLLVP
jgi:hypothetical protein